MIWGIVLVVVGVMALAGGSASWVVFGLGLWACCYFVMGGRRRRWRLPYRSMAWMTPGPRQAVPPYPVVPAPAPAVPAPAAAPVTRPPGRLPAGAEARAERIRRKAAVLMQHADRFPLGSKDLYVVQHTASDYLPATVGAFLEVPPWSVNRPVASDGRTALQMLNDQLDMLEGKLDEIAEHVLHQRVDRLLANERFLEESFGREQAELTIPR